MGNIIQHTVFFITIKTAFAGCESADYRTIVGAASAYTVWNMVSDISVTTNDIAAGFGYNQ